MPREEKHGRRAFLEEAVPGAGPVASRGVIARWFAALDPKGDVPAPPARTVSIAVLPLLGGALLSAALIHDLGVRVLLSLTFVTVAGVVASLASRGGAGRSEAPKVTAGRAAILPWWSRWWPRPQAVGPLPRSSRGLELDGERLAFHPGRSGPPPSARARISLPVGTVLLLLDGPFGVTLLSGPRRDRLIALLTSASGTFFLGAAFDAAARRAFAPLLDRAHTIVGDDAGLEAIGPDGEPLALAPDELASLLDALVERSPTCLDRFVLTDARGAAVTLDGRSLCVGDRAVDLNAPLEWRPIVFQEAFGQAIAVYQGTWIRQSSTEMVLVSLLPPLGPMPGADLEQGSLDRSVLRDLRLMQASPEAPPPSEQRVAIDRLFMLPVRSALDRAPRASHQPNRAQV